MCNWTENETDTFYSGTFTHFFIIKQTDTFYSGTFTLQVYLLLNCLQEKPSLSVQTEIFNFESVRLFSAVLHVCVSYTQTVHCNTVNIYTNTVKDTVILLIHTYIYSTVNLQ